jgi:hypothetical protein
MAAGSAAGLATARGEARLISQREALRALGVVGVRPVYAGDVSAYVGALSRAGEEAELIDPAGFGGYYWLVHAVGARAREVIALLGGGAA